MNNNLVVGIDIGGTHITAALIDLHSHTLIRQSLVRHSVNAKGSVDQIINQWGDAIIECKSFNSESSKEMGIAMPGPFDYEKGISLIKGLDKYEALYKLNVKDLLAAKLGIERKNISMTNDASCFLKGEIFCGTSGDCKNVIGITLGTGLGSAILKDEVHYDGDLYCTSFKGQTAEDYLSARWFLKRYRELTGTIAKNVKEISEKIPGDKNAELIFKEFGENLGEVLSTFVTIHGAEKVIIGGNIMKAWDLFIPETEKVLKRNSMNVTLLKARLGEESALMGAGSLCAQEPLF
ncbi:MAG: ROK family protein [Ginsengibacter sp.]